MTGDYRWTEVYDYACKAFGQTPRPEDEEAIRAVFARNPLLVISEVDRIAEALGSGRVKWAWSAFAKRLDQAPVTEVVVSPADERAKAVATAERWLRSAGMHFDRWSEVEDELYSQTGFVSGMHRRVTLGPWHADDGLRDRMRLLWEQARPDGVQLEDEADERARAFVAKRQEIAEALKAKRDNDDFEEVAVMAGATT